MYRIFCESYENFKETFDDENYRLKLYEPILNLNPPDFLVSCIDFL